MSENQKLREALLSDMDIAVLRMPVHLAFAGNMAQFQYHNRVQALLARIEALALPPDVPETTFRGMREALQLIAWSNDSKWQADCARQALALPTADHLPDAGEMVEAAAPVGEREAFERTMMDKYGWQREDFKLDDFGYFDGHTDTAWMAWQARAALSAGDAGWQPIETAPMDGRLGLVYRPLAANTRDEPIAIKSLIGGDRFCWPNTAPKGSAPTNPTDGACHVTHWMPLPPAPAMRKDKP